MHQADVEVLLRLQSCDVGRELRMLCVAIPLFLLHEHFRGEESKRAEADLLPGVVNHTDLSIHSHAAEISCHIAAAVPPWIYFRNSLKL